MAGYLPRDLGFWQIRLLELMLKDFQEKGDSAKVKEYEEMLRKSRELRRKQ